MPADFEMSVLPDAPSFSGTGALRTLSLVLVAVGVLVWVGCDTGGSTLNAGRSPSLLDIINTHKQTTGTFRSALNSTGRAQMLDDTTETYTVFVPSQAAFESHDTAFLTDNSDRLGAIVDYHIVEGTALESGDLEAGDTFTTLLGEELRIFSGGTVEGSEIVIDAEATNGVVHILDNVLLKPLTLGERFQATPRLRRLVGTTEGLLSDAGRLEVLSNPDSTYTVFAPSNEALEDYDFGGNTELIRSVLNYHVVKDTALVSDDFGSGNRYRTVQGDEIQVFGSTQTINTTAIDTTDVQYASGVVHVLDDVLLSNRSIPERLEVTIASETFFETLNDAGLAGEFASGSGWTVFAPNSDSLDNADLSGFSDEEIQQILNYHVFDQIEANSTTISTELDRTGGEFSFPTRQGEELTVSREGSEIVFNNGQAILSTEGVDQNATNGIIHRIEGVLIPPSLQE